MNKRAIGSAYEQKAILYLMSIGYDIIEHNYYSRFGEIDIIAVDNQTYVFIEVKYRTSHSFGKPYEAVDYNKQKHMMKTAVTYCKKYKLFNHNLRFDIVDILVEEVTHYKNAFEMDPRFCQF